MIRWVLIVAILIVILALLAYQFWPRPGHPNRCVCGHRLATHSPSSVPSSVLAKRGYCLRSDCDCQRFQQA